MVAAGGDGARSHVDAREGRRLDKGGAQIVGIRHRGALVEDSDDGAIREHVAGVDAVGRRSQRRTTPAAGAEDYQTILVHRGLVVAVEVPHSEGRHLIIVVDHREPIEGGFRLVFGIGRGLGAADQYQ